nr:FAD-binding oxidoreductase [Microvirga tunisiensis]
MLRSNLIAAFPVFKNMQILERWAGLVDATPDAVPVISAVDEKPGLFISTGFSGHGFGIGPGAGKLMADLVTSDMPTVDPTPFEFSRLRKGARAILREDILAGIGIESSKTEDAIANR